MQVALRKLACLMVLAVSTLRVDAATTSDPLPSWNNGPAKQNILAFVSTITDSQDKNFVPAAQRIAAFDNDGTLWAEQPIYFQFQFAIDEVKALAPRHPEWKTREPFKSVLAGDMRGVLASGEKGLAQLIFATHTGMTTDQFSSTVSGWLASAKNPLCKCPYTSLAYRPMLELLSYLRNSGFKTYIVSGGTTEFMRAFAERVYGVPPEQVIGTSFETKFMRGPSGAPVLMREAKIDFVDDGPGKPVAIQKFIGRKPIFAFGNSDGDQQMLEWTAAGPGLRFMGLVHHTDGAREFAYDRNSKIGTLDKALDEATEKGWTVVDMAKDWRVVFPDEVHLVTGLTAGTRASP